jgi:tRNA(Ile)-lysidine synthase
VNRRGAGLGSVPPVEAGGAGAAWRSSEALTDRFAAFERFDIIGIAVSGGADSVALMRLVAFWRQTRQQAGHVSPDVVVLSVDHGLRAEAASECAAVAEWAMACGLSSETLVWRGRKPETGIQDAARRARYALLAGWAAKRSGRVAIATAHHIEDQAETILMRLRRGSGVDGLAGIRAVSERDGVLLLRPLLDLTKATLVSFLDDIGATWIEDPSNEALAFERVRIRAARECRDRLGLSDDALALSARRMSRASEALEWATRDAMRLLLVEQPYLRLGGFVWPSALDLPDEIVIRLLNRVLMACGGRGDGRHNYAADRAAIERLAAAIRQPSFQGGTLGRCQVRRERFGFLVHREAHRRALPRLRLEAGQTAIWDRRFEVQVEGEGSEGPIDVCGHDARAEAVLRDILPLAELERVPLPLRPCQPVFWQAGRLLAAPAYGYPDPTGTLEAIDDVRFRCTARFIETALTG